MTEIPKIGAIVRYQWGLGTAEGEVIEVYEGSNGPHVVLRVNASGLPEDPIYTTLALPLEWVSAA